MSIGNNGLCLFLFDKIDIIGEEDVASAVGRGNCSFLSETGDFTEVRGADAFRCLVQIFHIFRPDDFIRILWFIV